jgi:heat-inducible transcriptional repressor
VQPHTSAGRIPSDAGYRTYVDRLMPPQALSAQEQRRISEELRATSLALEEVIEQTARMLGHLSHSVAFAVGPSREAQIFRHIQLIWLSSRSGLAVVVTSVGVATQHRFDHSEDVDADGLTRLSNRLNERFGGRALGAVTAADVEEVAESLGLPHELASVVLDALRGASAPEDPIVASSGAQNLLDQPEFQDLRKLRAILQMLEEQKHLADLVVDSIHAEGPVIKIGAELQVDEMAECSLVTVPYNLGGNVSGVLAILGPRRMEYARILALAGGTALTLERHFDSTERH